MNDIPENTNQGTIRRIWARITAPFGAAVRGINAAGTFVRNLNTLFWAGVAIVSIVGGLVWFREPLLERLRTALEQSPPPTLSEPPTPVGEPPPTTATAPPCHADATWLYATLMAHKEKHPEREWTLDSLLRATAWGQPKCFVAELIYQPEFKSGGGYRTILETTMWVGKELVSVRLNADSRAEPHQLKRHAFIAVTGELARFWRMSDGSLVLTLENAAFSDQWSKALEPRQTDEARAQR